jgi:hypothetical protein
MPEAAQHYEEKEVDLAHSFESTNSIVQVLGRVPLF